MAPAYMLLLNDPPPIFNFDLLEAIKVLIQRLELNLEKSIFYVGYEPEVKGLKQEGLKL